MSLPSAFRPPSLTALVAAGLLAPGTSDAPAQAVRLPSVNQRTAVAVVEAAIAEASWRFGVPEHWIRAVIRVESANNARAASPAGAMGLMQVMPATYAGLRRRYGLGPDPFNPRDNILAGTAYLREMHDRYGPTGMLAAYNAGPGRWEEHLAGTRHLPPETLAYLARLGPVVGARALPAATPVQVERSPAAPPRTLFAASNDTANAAMLQAGGQKETTAKPPALPVESVFVRRSATSVEQPGNMPSPLPNPLFAPVGGSGSGQ